MLNKKRNHTMREWNNKQRTIQMELRPIEKEKFR